MEIFNHYRGLSKEVYIICVSKFVQTLGAFILPLFVMILKTKVEMMEGQITVFMTVIMTLGFVSSLLGGVLTDKFGKKRTIIVFELLASLIFMSIIFFDIGFITAILLSSGMFFFGISGPAHGALLSNVTKTEEKESAYSLLYLAKNLGIIVGPALGGMLIKNHFNLFIILDVISTFVGLILLGVFVKEKKAKVIVNELEKETKDSIFRIIIDRPVIVFYGILAFFISFTYGQLDFTLPLYVEKLFVESERVFGLLYSFNGFTVVLATALITYKLKKKTALDKVFVGFTIYILTLYAFSNFNSLYLLFILMFIFTIGEIIISIGIAPILSKIVPSNILGRINGVMNLFYMTGHMAATILPGILLDNEYSFKFVWLSVATVSLVGYAYLFFFKIRYGSIINQVDMLDKNRK